MTDKNLFHKNIRFYRGLIFTVLEGLLSGSNYIVIYAVLTMLYDGTASMRRIFSLTGLVGAIFVIRLVIYSIGYTQSQIGGAEVSKNIRLGLGDKLRKLPLSGFTEKREGQYINIMTADVNGYEQILTHKLASLVKTGFCQQSCSPLSVFCISRLRSSYCFLFFCCSPKCGCHFELWKSTARKRMLLRPTL